MDLALYKATAEGGAVKAKQRPRFAQMSRRRLGTLHGLMTDAWRTLHNYDRTAPVDFRFAAKHAADNLNAALKIIEKKQGPLS